MASVFQQVIIDKVTAVPKASGTGAITRDDANSGILVTKSAVAEQSNATQKKYREYGFASPVVEKVSVGGALAAGNLPYGVLLDYHSERRCTIARKGRVIVASAYRYSPLYNGAKIALDPTAVSGTTPKAHIVTSGGIGQVIGGGINREIGHYFIVDINLPHRGDYPLTLPPRQIEGYGYLVLANAISASDTSLGVFLRDLEIPESGTVTIGTEQMTYTRIDHAYYTDNYGNQAASRINAISYLYGLTRGANSTTAQAHAARVAVSFTL